MNIDRFKKTFLCGESMLKAFETRLLYDRKEAARQLSISVRSLDYIIAAKGLETRRIGGKVLVTQASLMRYAAGNHFGSFKDVANESTADRKEASSQCA
jgi:hypothetical protein